MRNLKRPTTFKTKHSLAGFFFFSALFLFCFLYSRDGPKRDPPLPRHFFRPTVEGVDFSSVPDSLRPIKGQTIDTSQRLSCPAKPQGETRSNRVRVETKTDKNNQSELRKRGRARLGSKSFWFILVSVTARRSVQTISSADRALETTQNRL